jgi:hypothetical protein
MFANMSTASISSSSSVPATAEESQWAKEAAERKAVREQERQCQASAEPPSEREQMASALFMGLSGGGGGGKTKPAYKPQARVTRQTYQTPAPTANVGGGMFGGMQTTANAPAPAATTAAPTQELDFNSMFAFNDPPTPAAQQPTNTNTATQQDTVAPMTNFNDLFISAPATQSLTQTPMPTPASGQSTASSGGFPGFGNNVGFSAAFDTSNVSSDTASNSPVGYAAVKADVKQRFAAVTDVDAVVDTQVANADWLHASVAQVSPADSAWVVLFITNKNQGLSAEQDFQVSVSVPLQLRVTHAEGLTGAVESKASSNTLNLTLPKVMGGYTRTVLLHVKCVDPSAYKVKGFNVTVLSSNTGQSAKFVAPFDVSAMLRPHSLTTPQFGQAWKRCGPGAECKFTVAGGSTSTNAQLVGTLKRLRIHHVQSINLENICASTLVGLGDKAVILVHVKLPKSTTAPITVLIRSQNKQMSASLQQLLSNNL